MWRVERNELSSFANFAKRIFENKIETAPAPSRCLQWCSTSTFDLLHQKRFMSEGSGMLINRKRSIRKDSLENENALLLESEPFDDELIRQSSMSRKR